MMAVADLPRTEPDTATRPTWWQRRARQALRERLAALADGQLAIVDGNEVHRFGVARTTSHPDAVRSTSDPLHATVTVLSPRFYTAVALGGSLGAAESYLRGEWTCDDLTQLVRLLIRNRRVLGGVESWATRWKQPVERWLHGLRRNSVAGSRANIAAHYDLGNDFFELFLDETLMYSCAVFESAATTLADASRAKNDLICRKLHLSPNDQVLEIGTGWGGFALHAASRYGCRITTTTISPAQFALARQRIAAAGLSERVNVVCEDYRALRGQYDKLVSIEMIEAVGLDYLETYFRCCNNLLRPGGQFLLQAITIADQRFEAYQRSVDFIQRYIFPGGALPALSIIAKSIQRATEFQPLHYEDLTPHYARTLRMWHERFQARRADVLRLGYSAEFARCWEFYLCYCEAAFMERNTQSVQLLLQRC